MAQRNGNPEARRRWNEYQWEEELRREDRRISCYFRELPLCLDLPGEEEMIFEEMQSRPGLVPAGASPGHWRIWDDPVFSREGDAGDTEQVPIRRPGDEWIERLDDLLVEWNALSARSLPLAFEKESLAVSCGFGKLIVRMSDFIDTEKNELAALKICLGKRAVSDVHELCCMLEAVAALQPSAGDLAMHLAGVLQDLREYLTDQLAALRRDRRKTGEEK